MPTLDSATRDRIVAAATDLIMERGYEKTTMRAIAERADVSLGSAYYYFGGKEELVQGFYLAIARKHHELLQDRIAGVTSFGKRLDACFEAFLDACDEYRSISDSLLSLAIVPTSPLSPFSAQSRAPRNQFLRTFEELVEGSDLKTDRAVARGASRDSVDHADAGGARVGAGSLGRPAPDSHRRETPGAIARAVAERGPARPVPTLCDRCAREPGDGEAAIV